jgi:hypothetical protein
MMQSRRTNLQCRAGFWWWQLHRLDSSSTFSSSYTASPCCFVSVGHFRSFSSSSVGLSLLLLPRRDLEPVVLVVRPFVFDLPPAFFFIGPFQSFQTTLVPPQSRIIIATAKTATGPPCGGGGGDRRVLVVSSSSF